jgi:Zn-finger nucleic acid-binding protein
MRLVLPNIDVEVSRKKVSTWNLLEEPQIVMRRKSDNREVVKKARSNGVWLDGWEWNYVVEAEEGYEEVETEDIDHYVLKQKADGGFEEIPFTPPREQTKEIVITKENLVPKTFLTKFLVESTYELYAKRKKNKKKGTAEIDRLVQSKLWKDAQEWVADGVMGIFPNYTWGRGSPKRYYVLVYPLLLKTDENDKKSISEVGEADSFVWIMHTTAVGIDYRNAMAIPVKEVIEVEEEQVVETAQRLTSILA